MGNFVFCLLGLSFLSFGCQGERKNKENIENVLNDSTQNFADKFSSQNYYTKKDSVLLATFEGDSVYVSKEEFNNVVANHSEFFSEYPFNPDITYLNNTDEIFTSEIGQDLYYLYYAYFLRQSQEFYKTDDFGHQRNKIMIIYTRLNQLESVLNNGGAGYMHLYRRIFGYAEYSVYLYFLTRNNFTVTYDISEQKKLFKKTLQQIVTDRLKNTFDVLDIEKSDIKEELFKLIDEIDHEIIDSFYLNQAQKFYYDNYATW